LKLLYSIETKSLTKSFGDLVAVNNISFSVEKGEIFGFLGPNGAGKSTTMMIFTTLLKPTNGYALVGGFDVLKNPKQVRESIGFVQQETTVDEYLSGRENLLLQAKLNHIPKNEINQRIDEVLDLIELSDKQDEAVVTYSGGMRKRLDIAGGLLHHPRVLFLDEPTVGLDIQTRRKIWQYIKKIHRMGMSLKESISEVKNPTYLISMLNEHLFENLGYSGDDDDYYNPKNNFLNEVIDKKTGLPITISILYAEIAKFVGLDLKIVGFPGHVLVKYNEEMILDPFYDGRLLDIDDLQEILDVNFGGELEFKPEFLDEVKAEQILIRMVRNLKNSSLIKFNSCAAV